ncbi:MAG: methyltransferase [Acidimicrobiales bacterium]|nr:methyltransferase [Acidimicrobiales bacterium]
MRIRSERSSSDGCSRPVAPAPFCGEALHVALGVYVPRIQSEEVACRAAALLPDNGRAVDLCTGVGAVGAHLMAVVPTAAVIGIDVDVRAAANARRNGVAVAVADLAEPVRCHEGVDVVTAVAPYVPTGELQLLSADVQRYEPRLALDGGADGLDLSPGGSSLPPVDSFAPAVRC